MIRPEHVTFPCYVCQEKNRFSYMVFYSVYNEDNGNILRPFLYWCRVCGSFDVHRVSMIDERKKFIKE